MKNQCPCGKRIKGDSWKCERCWRELGKGIEFPSAASLRELSWEQRALVFLHFAGQDITEYFDTRLPLPPDDSDDMIECLDHLATPPLDAPYGWRNKGSFVSP